MNVGRLIAPLDSPQIAPFVAALAEVNRLAEQSDGFLWRFQTDSGNATDYIATEDPLFLLNLSLWRDLPSLQAFVYQGLHRQFLNRRKEWFELPTEPILVLWHTPDGHIPTPEEGLERLHHLRRHGPSAYAFTPAWLAANRGT